MTEGMLTVICSALYDWITAQMWKGLKTLGADVQPGTCSSTAEQEKQK